MANGFYGTSEEWERLEAPLKLIDGDLERFATKYNIELSRDDGSPERSLIWDHGVRCLIQIFIASERLLTYHLWLSASHDFGDAKYWKYETLVNNKKIDEFRPDLPELLEEGHEKLMMWSNTEIQRLKQSGYI
jgi:hypothetical protein